MSPDPHQENAVNEAVVSSAAAANPGAKPPAAVDPSGTQALGVTPARLVEVLQAAGYRATLTEVNGIIEVRSAAQGLSFIARFGNRSGVQRQFFDFTLFCPLNVTGRLAPGVVELWNRSRRFARLGYEQQFLILSMDVLAAGGVPDAYLRAQCELWDKMLQDLILYLRQSGSPTPATETSEAAPISPSTAHAH